VIALISTPLTAHQCGVHCVRNPPPTPHCQHPHRHHTCHILLTIIQTANILIDIVLVTSYLLSSTPPASSPPSSLTSYSSRRIVQLPNVCRSESCTNNFTKLVDLLATSYLLSSMPPASSSTLSSSHRIVQLPTVCPSESCANNSRSSSIFSPRLTCYHPCRRHPHRHRTCCVLLAIIHAAGILTAILIDIVLVASYSLLSLRLASSLVSTSLMSFSLRRVSSDKLLLLLSRRAMPSTVTWYIDVH